MSLLLRNALGVTLDPPSAGPCDVRIADGRIVARAGRLEPHPGEETLDLAGAVLTPGLVCAHTHLYSALARGMPPPAREPHNFLQILERVWWRLDKALDPDTILWSARVGAMEAARCGVTTLVDHHASPAAVPGSLDLIRDALAEVGVRGVLCYETSDRDGTAIRDQGLEENRRFATASRNDPRFRGLIGAHASFTLADDSLRRLGELAAALDTGVHVHVAEDRSDVRLTRERYRRGIIERFGDTGVLRRGSVFAHCIHLEPRAFAVIRELGAWTVHNPRSNMNNHVGHAPLEQFGERSALGCDGFTPDLFEEARVAWFRNQEATPRAPATTIPRLLQGGQRLISEVFGRTFGTLEPGAEADLVVLDYAAPTPLTDGNAAMHLLFGGRTAMVRSVMVAGKWIVRDGALLNVDERGRMHAAAAEAGRLWEAMA
jgi:putative selenium metabolism protein SsnA